jgi:hypothetical protein
MDLKNSLPALELLLVGFSGEQSPVGKALLTRQREIVLPMAVSVLMEGFCSTTRQSLRQREECR